MSRKSLGTLTLDLIAKVGGFEQGMDKASRKSQKTAKQIEKYSNEIGQALTKASAVAIAGMTALVTSTANGAREVRNMAQVSGSSVQEFQRGAYAVKRYGIETDKYADILKDVNDRVGDFLQTGGGPMADFFENIAPKVGVTADQFARLSGPEALQLYVNSLQKAGVSQKEMTFYMEAIASDATALLPLLKDNGKRMKDLGDEAERTGNVFSDLEFDQLESIRRSMDELTGAATGMKNEVVVAALPAIEDLVDMLSDQETLSSAKSLGMAIVESVKFAVSAIDGAIRVTKFLAEELAAFVHGPAFGDLPRMQEEINDQEALVKTLRERSKLPWGPSDRQVEEAVAKLEKLRKEYELAVKMQQDALSGSGGNPGGTGNDITSPPEAPDTSLGAAGPGDPAGNSKNKFVSDRFKDQMNAQVETYREYQEEQTRIAREQAAERQQIEQQAQSAITAMHQSTWQAAAGFLNTFAGESKAAALASIAITKGLAIAETFAHTQTASMLAFASQLIPGDPTSIARAEAASASVQAMGAVKAALIGATGLAQAYQAVSGGGSVGTGGYSSSGTHPPTTAAADPTMSQNLEDNRRPVSINFYGNVNGLDADQIARSIKDHLESTDFVLIESETRNGRILNGK